MTIATRQRVQRVPVERSRILSLSADALVFAVGLTTNATVRLIGDLPIAEVILVAMLPIILATRGYRSLRKDLRAVFALLGLWLFGQVITDIYRSTAMLDWIRGDAAIIFFGIDILGLGVLLSGNDRRKAIFMAANAIGTILVALIHPSKQALDQPWKFGYASGVISLVLLVSCFFYARRRYLYAGAFIVAIAIVNLLENFRSPVLNLLIGLALVFPVIPEKVGSMRILPRAGSAMRVAVLVGMALGAVLLTLGLIKFVTNAGLLGEEAQEKNRTQEQAGGLLLGGRPEILVSSRAVMDSPIIGHGSWARDYKYIELLIDTQEEYGVKPNMQDIVEHTGGFIPAHSHLMGAWVWAGILGATFWAYIVWLIVKATIPLSNLRPPLAPVYAYAISASLFNVMFSPFGLNMRLIDGAVIIFLCDLLATGTTSTKVLKWKRRLIFRRRGSIRHPEFIGDSK